MAVVEELRHHLVTGSVGARGASTSAASIFVTSLPEWPGISVVLAEGVGGAPTRHFGNAVPAIEQHRIEMLVRSTAPAAGGGTPLAAPSRTVANAAYRSLVSIADMTLTSTEGPTSALYLSVEALAPPHLFDRDARGRMYWRTLFTVDRAST